MHLALTGVFVSLPSCDKPAATRPLLSDWDRLQLWILLHSHPRSCGLESGDLAVAQGNLPLQCLLRIALEGLSGSDWVPSFRRAWISPEVPKRLLDLNVGSSTLAARPMDTAEGFVYDPKSSRNVINYAALSYCWGSAADARTQLKTTRRNLE